MPTHGRERTGRDFVRIDDAAAMLGRSVETLRKWSQRKPPTLLAYRDGVTKFRWFKRKDVEALMPRAAAS